MRHDHDEDAGRHATDVEALRKAWDRCAAGWDANTARIRPWLADVTRRMLDAAAIAPGHRVLDVAAGAGDQTIDVARRVTPGGQVLATDVSPAILDLAARNARAAGLANVAVRVTDAETLDVPAAAFDAAVCRLGLMFCGDPARALARMHAALVPGARAAVLVFGGPRENPCIAAMTAIALAHAGRPPADPFAPGTLLSLGRPDALAAAFASAGFTEVAVTPVAAPFRLPSVVDYVDFVRTSGTPLVEMLARLDAPARDAAWAAITQDLARFDTGDGWVGPNTLLLASGRRPG